MKLILDILPQKHFQKLIGVGGASVLIVVDLIQFQHRVWNPLSRPQECRHVYLRRTNTNMTAC